MRKRCVRKIWEKVNPIEHVLAAIKPTEEAEMDKVRAAELAAIAAFTTGKARLQEWREINEMLSVTEYLASNGVGPEALDACQDAQNHLIDAAKRFERTGRMGMTGSGLQALRALYEYHDLQRQSITRGEYKKALNKTEQRIKSRAPEVLELSGASW